MTGVWAALCVVLLGTQAGAQGPGVSVSDIAVRYTRYIPSMCIPDRAQWHGSRQAVLDTVAWSPFVRQWHPDAVAEARACVAKFSVETTQGDSLLDLGSALVIAGDTAKATSAFQRVLQNSATKPLPVRTRELYLMAAAFVKSKPANLPGMRPYWQRLEALGDSAYGERLQVNAHVIDVAMQADSLRLVEEYANDVIAISKKLPVDSAKRYFRIIIKAYVARADLQIRRDSIAAGQATLKECSNIINRIRPPQAHTIGDIIASYSLLGTEATRIIADRWMNADSTSVSPAPERVSLLMFVRSECGSDCYEGYAVLRQLIKRFPELNVTLVTNTGGYYRTNLVTPDVEAALVRDYFRDAVGITEPLAILESDFDRRASDGRLLIKKNPNNEAYKILDISRTDFGGPIIFVVDKHNIIRWKAALSFATAMGVNNIIGELSQ